MWYSTVPMQHNDPLEPVFVYLLHTHLPPSLPSSIPTQHQSSLMASPAPRPTPPVLPKLPISTVPPSPLLTQPVCPKMIEQYRSVHLAQGVGGLHRVSPGLLTMPQQKKQSEGKKTGEGRVTDGFNKKNSPSGSAPPHSTDLWPPINIPSLWQTQGCNGWIPFPTRGDLLLTMGVVFVLTGITGWECLNSPLVFEFLIRGVLSYHTAHLDQHCDAGETFLVLKPHGSLLIIKPDYMIVLLSWIERRSDTAGLSWAGVSVRRWEFNLL